MTAYGLRLDDDARLIQRPYFRRQRPTATTRTPSFASLSFSFRRRHYYIDMVNERGSLYMTANDVLPHISISKNLFYIIRISIQYKYMYVRRFFFKPAHSLLFHSPLRPFVRHLREMKECQGLFSEKLWISFGCMGNLYNKESATTTRENNFETSRKKKNDEWLCAFARLRFYTEPYACKRATIYRRQVTAVSSQPRAILAHSFAVVFPISLYIAVLRRSEI